MRMPKSSVPVLIGGASLALALTACSASGQESSPADAGAPSESSTSHTSAEAGSTDASAPATAPPQDLQSIGEHPSGQNPDSVVVLNSVTASDGTMTVQFSLQNNAEEDDIQVADMFGDGVQDATSEDDQGVEGSSVDGVFVTTGEQKRYLVGRGENGICACSSNLSDKFIEPGETMSFSAVFAAPPQDVQQVDVHIPTAGVFTDIPVQR